MAAGTRFVKSPRAVPLTVDVARAALKTAAGQIARALPGNVPVHSGGAQASYRPEVASAGESEQVHVGSPFWHWLEYGTAYSPAYRPVERTVRGLGLRFEAQ